MGRLTYTDIKNAHYRNLGKVSSTDTSILSDFQYNLGQRYQMAFGSLTAYINSQTQESNTVASQQYYYYPVGIVGVDDAFVTIGEVKYPLSTIYDTYTWDQINALTIQPTAIPQFIFPRKDDFGIWPIPQDTYTLTLNGFMRDRNLMVEDYLASNVTVAQGSLTVTGTGTAFTSAMVGRWFTITDTSVWGEGYWYRVGGVTSATSLTLETYWAGDSATNVLYRVGETPELPEEAHTILAAGTTADFYAGMRGDIKRSTWFDNIYWTGSGVQNSREIGDPNIMGGLIGLINKYENRDRRILIRKQPPILSPMYKVWAQTLSNS